MVEQEDASGDASPTEPIHIESESHLEDVAASNDVVLVDFYADWCGPCKMLEPIVEAVAAETDAAVAKVDIDELRQLAMQYQVQGVPTMALFSDGSMVERMVGFRDKDTLASLVGEYAN